MLIWTGSISSRPSGSCSGYSLEWQLLLTFHDLASRQDQGLQTDTGSLDFSKPFDTLPHHRLLNKLSHHGIDGNCHRWIKAFLTGPAQKAMVDGEFSGPTPVASGFPQGTVLGPLISLLFIHDMPSMLSLALESVYLQTIA